MTKYIDAARELRFINFYPKIQNVVSGKKGVALIGIGSNIGNSERIFKLLYRYFQSHPKVKIIRTSPLYKNPPFGYLQQQSFLNGVILLKTVFNPNELMRFLLHTEKIFGRKRVFKNGPRTLDLDVIFFEKLFVYNKNIIIPHPKWQERDSVLIPMMFINSRFVTI